eukprot:9018718-Ditylum_brightwellii.AAC.1
MQHFTKGHWHMDRYVGVTAGTAGHGEVGGASAGAMWSRWMEISWLQMVALLRDLIEDIMVDSTLNKR